MRSQANEMNIPHERFFQNLTIDIMVTQSGKIKPRPASKEKKQASRNRNGSANGTSHARKVEALRATIQQIMNEPDIPMRPPKLTHAEHINRLKAAVGSLASAPLTVDDFLARKQEEIQLEEERFQRLHGKR